MLGNNFEPRTPLFQKACSHERNPSRPQICPPTPLNFSTNIAIFWKTPCLLLRYCGLNGLILGRTALFEIPAIDGAMDIVGSLPDTAVQFGALLGTGHAVVPI
ncbi:MAG: hypothetical protein ACN6OR_00875 [Stenotrophomonas sp.]